MKYYDRAWNPIYGCKGNFAGCEHCYAKTMAKKRGYKNPFDFVGLNLKQYSRRFGNEHEIVSVCTQSDLFQDTVIENSENILNGIIRKCWSNKQNDYLFLTKFSKNLKDYFSSENRIGMISNNHFNEFSTENMKFGVTVCINDDKHRINDLKTTSVIKHRFVAFEPLMERISLTEDDLNGIEWVIVGCDSENPNADFDIDWMYEIIGLADKCGIPVFVNNVRINGERIEHDELPENLRRNENPYE